MSRSRHAKDMDKNTRYFHQLASAKRRNNRINDALLLHGRLVRNQARIKVAIRGFYKDLYRKEYAPLIGFREGLVMKMDENEATALEIMPSAEEVKEAVWDCESTKAPASMSTLINGTPSKPFKMERGLRQGDPLSPFLFVLVVDVLRRMVAEAVRNGRISPLLVGRDNIELSHFQFADDTILFCPPETETILNYKRLLLYFELMSGLSINFDKSNLIFVNCESEWVTNICGILGCTEAVLPVRYLEISLEANPRLVKT
ncbi:uncharacterized protein LOC130967294 [Arachis stenosperma]|uniref:uncharacterized protein LOC130967294 n=1 Tax=Arachis stenosperma TaxID=217475 RepID=UPI0025AD2E1B|nr:uncharacterized protein LOC130967294 [Arachis stenosperma]